MKGAVRTAYEEWFNSTQPKDQPARQIIEMRRAFYSGVFAALVPPILSADVQANRDEVEAFYLQEVRDQDERNKNKGT